MDDQFFQVLYDNNVARMRRDEIITRTRLQELLESDEFQILEAEFLDGYVVDENHEVISGVVFLRS